MSGDQQDAAGEKTLHRAGSLAAIRASQSGKATVNGQKIALFAVGDSVVATNGRCPHAHGPLHNGEVEGEILTCPWHGWTFNLRSGVCDEDPDLNLERFEVVIDGDDILVRL